MKTRQSDPQATPQNPPSPLINLLHLLTGLMLVLATLTIMASFLMLFFDDSELRAIKWPISVSSQTVETVTPISYQTTADSNFSSYVMNVSQGTLKINSNALSYKAIYAFFLCLYGVMGLGILLMMRRVIASVEYSNPFTKDNVTRLNTVALLLFLYFPVGFLNSIAMHWYIKHNIQLTDGEFTSNVFLMAEFVTNELLPNQIYLSNIHEFKHLVFALLFITIAQVFSRGIELKDDNESIL